MIRHSCLKFSFATITLALVIGARASRAQSLAFWRQAPELDGFSTAVADASGVYVSWNSGVRKYDSAGNQLWIEN